MLPYQQQIHSILESYLSREGASYKTIKNYRSDIDDFLNWFSTTTATQGFHPSSVAELTQKINSNTLLNYRAHLERELKTEATITRRYSSIRALIRACEDAGIIAPNQLNNLPQTNTVTPLPPAEISSTAQQATSSSTTITNEPLQPTAHKLNHQELVAFSEALKNQGLPQDAVAKKTTHIADFLSWFTTRHTN